MPSDGQPPKTSNARYLALRQLGPRVTSRRVERAAARQKSLYKVDRSSDAITAHSPTRSEISHIATFLIHATLPYRDPGSEVHLWRRSYTQGDTTAIVTFQSGTVFDAHGREVNLGLPFGVYPRLILADASNRIIQTRNPTLQLGASITEWARESLGLPVTGGPRGSITALREQMIRLLKCSLHIEYEGSGTGPLPINGQLFPFEADLGIWSPERAAKLKAADYHSYLQQLQNPTFITNRLFFAEVLRSAMPFDLRIQVILAKHRSPLAIDLFRFLNHKQFHLVKSQAVAPVVYTWRELANMLGQNNAHLPDFVRSATNALELLLPLYPEARAEARSEGLLVRPGASSVPSRKKSALSLAAASKARQQP